MNDKNIDNYPLAPLSQPKPIHTSGQAQKRKRILHHLRAEIPDK